MRHGAAVYLGVLTGGWNTNMEYAIAGSKSLRSQSLMFTILIMQLWLIVSNEARLLQPPSFQVPDEQRLYRQLMADYESSVRPVLNASQKITVRFKLSLNQIIDLDERKQVLTTNIFIDQQWEDDHLRWPCDEYSGIKTIRIPADLIWLPDTFIFNNADDGSTGFMNGVYVVLNCNGSVLWPVPVKLKSSCHVDITYFPFDDQRCILRFGSWIYSSESMDFESSLESVNLDYYVDNSEWQLLAIQYEKGLRQYSCCPSPHPDLTYTLHIRRRTFYYVFNIIIPCIMLSVLTLLTFWLPTTSGEKISLGLSVFLAFSMFMLLIAEEVPATSKSVPLIGVYLTTVMTMTSVSVIMSVMVINLYNRGYRAKSAPAWLKTLILNWLCKLLNMKHDIEKLAKAIRLEEEEEAKFKCEVHEEEGPISKRWPRSPRHHRRQITSPAGDQTHINDVSAGDHRSEDVLADQQSTDMVSDHRSEDVLADRQSTDVLSDHCSEDVLAGDHRSEDVLADRQSTDMVSDHQQTVVRSPGQIRTKLFSPYECGAEAFVTSQPKNALRSANTPATDSSCMDSCDDDEPVWRRRETLIKEQREMLLKRRRERRHEHFRPHQAAESRGRASANRRESFRPWQNAESRDHASANQLPASPSTENREGLENDNSFSRRRGRSERMPCNKHVALMSRREIVVEWQTMALVIDRLLFWIFLMATLIAYIVILFVIPYSKPKYIHDGLPIRVVTHS